MALIRLDHVPETTKVNQPLYLIVPDPLKLWELPLAQRKVLYLLHGLSDDGSGWQRYSSIETIASQYGLVVVMPTAGRSFYTDQPNGQLHFTYLVEELPQYLTNLFGLKPRREDTLIAGNSMGGYGAIKAALLHPELYFAAASFSGILSLEFLKAFPNDPRRDEFAQIFGELDQLQGSQHDPAEWLANAAQNPTTYPHFFIACGRQEDLYPLSGLFYSACLKAGLNAEYLEEDGQHDWQLWDRQIGKFLQKELTPLNSGLKP